jgi:UDP-N-acetylmuramate dehydrogenase
VLSRPLGPLTTYRVGGPAAVFLEVAGPKDLEAAHLAMMATGLPALVLGRGSNLLVPDAGFPGIVLALGPTYATVEVSEQDGRAALPTGVVRAGGAAYLPVLARRASGAGISGLEWAVGIPGTVGGGVFMNAGGHGSDMSECLVSTTVYDLTERASWTVAGSELGLGYRVSGITDTQVVISADLWGCPGDPDTSRARISEIVRWRRENQPGGANAGSVFKNPPGDAAGRLVDEAGLRGLRLRSAQVSAKHANFIQGDPGGSADDILDLIGEVRRRVAEDTGTWLEIECRIATSSSCRR